MKNFRRFLLLATPLIFIGCTGCSSSPKPNRASYAGAETFGATSGSVTIEVVALGQGALNKSVSEAIRESLSKMEQTTQRNKALIYADLGIAALQGNDLEQAEPLLEEARSVMGNLAATGDEERQAMAISGSEETKVFKGEPHERAILYLHSGLLFLAKNDFNNSQAAFKSGLLEDAIAGDDQSQGDWLSLKLLLLECKRRMGAIADAQDLASQIRKSYKQEELPKEWDDLAKDRAIVAIMVGSPPEKVGGESKEQVLMYRKVDSKIALIRVSKDSSTIVTASQPVDDCYIQASTRGHRGMDSVLAKKANFRKTVEGVGTGAVVVGSLVPYVGPLICYVKEISEDISEKVDSSADTRQMRMLPGRVFLFFVSGLQRGDGLTIQAEDATGRVIAEGTVTISSEPGSSVILARCPY